MRAFSLLRVVPVCIALLSLTGCGGSNPTPTSPTPGPSPAPSPNYPITGHVIDALTGAPIAGVSVRLNNGFSGTVTSDSEGRFDGSIPWGIIQADLSHPAYVTRRTYVRVYDPPQTLSLIPGSFSLDPFDTALRPAHVGLDRWTSTPALVVITREIQYAGAEDSPVVLDRDIPASTLDGLVADLRDGFLKMTDGRLGDFTSVTLESPAPGSRVLMTREGAIVVGRARDLVKIGHMGGATSRKGSAAGIVYARILLDADQDEPTSYHPTYPTHTRKHEMGHAVGFYHVGWESVMNVMDISYRGPTEWDVQAARIAYQRPPRNQSPDVDPDPNSAPSSVELLWNGAMAPPLHGAGAPRLPRVLIF